MSTDQFIERKLVQVSLLIMRARIDWLNGKMSDEDMEQFLDSTSEVLYLLSWRLESESDEG